MGDQQLLLPNCLANLAYFISVVDQLDMSLLERERVAGRRIIHG